MHFIIYIEILSYVRSFIIGTTGIVVRKLYLDTFVSEDLNFKPDANCVSPLDQAPRGQVRFNFIAMTT